MSKMQTYKNNLTVKSVNLSLALSLQMSKQEPRVESVQISFNTILRNRKQEKLFCNNLIFLDERYKIQKHLSYVSLYYYFLHKIIIDYKTLYIGIIYM